MDRIILTANEGYIFTNGTAYGVEVYLALNDNPGNWYEITKEEAVKMIDSTEEEA